MNKVYVPYILGFICLAFPPVLIIAIPALIIYLTTKGTQGAKMYQQQQTFIAHQQHVQRRAAVRGLK